MARHLRKISSEVFVSLADEGEVFRDEFQPRGVLDRAMRSTMLVHKNCVGFMRLSMVIIEFVMVLRGMKGREQLENFKSRQACVL